MHYGRVELSQHFIIGEIAQITIYENNSFIIILLCLLGIGVLVLLL
jgi:hypothetical protein